MDKGGGAQGRSLAAKGCIAIFIESLLFNIPLDHGILVNPDHHLMIHFLGRLQNLMRMMAGIVITLGMSGVTIDPEAEAICLISVGMPEYLQNTGAQGTSWEGMVAKLPS